VWRLEATQRKAIGFGQHHLKMEAELRSRVAVLRPAA
jgi:hypothetical protein